MVSSYAQIKIQIDGSILERSWPAPMCAPGAGQGVQSRTEEALKEAQEGPWGSRGEALGALRGHLRQQQHGAPWTQTLTCGMSQRTSRPSGRVARDSRVARHSRPQWATPRRPLTPWAMELLQRWPQPLLTCKTSCLSEPPMADRWSSIPPQVAVGS